MPRVVGAVKVTADPVLEHLGLADVDNLPLGVFHDVDAGERRQFCQTPLYVFAKLEHPSENSNYLQEHLFFYCAFSHFFIYLM